MTAADAVGVLTRRDESIATITLVNGKKNLLNPAVMNELHDAIAAADDDQNVLSIILTATGDMFCGGLDIAEIQNGGDPAEFATALVRLLKLMPQIGTSLVCAVNGDALASGFSIACACDFVLAVPESVLGTFEASIGIWPMIAQVPPLQRMLPRHALQNIMTGVPFSADEALKFGAINKIADADCLQQEARKMALAASGAGSALRSGRQSFYRFVDLPYEEALDEAYHSFTAMLKSS
ncbi:enoyl-CoA hydratase/isomerase family protein [Streptomyces chartreusis]|uniref:enoyl-CoA hydratase/isomerase family protein n=1 Tax=Streptomyces chartreusis TaxID=1969 RepID=UPI0036253CB5